MTLKNRIIKILKKNNFLFPIYILLKIIKDERNLYYYFQQFLRNIRIRNYFKKLEIYLIGKKSNRKLSFNSNKRKTQLIADGFCFLPNLLNETQINDIKKYLSNKNLIDLSRPENGIFTLNNRPYDSQVCHYLSRDIIKIPHLKNIINNLEVLKIFENVYGCIPRVDYIGAWWSFPSNKTEEQQFFHRDMDSLNFFKLFIYLSDVDSNDGPHVYIKGSHLENYKIKPYLRLSDHELLKKYDKNQFNEFYGLKGTSFLVDTFGIHKGKTPTRDSRLILQVIYSLKRTPYFDKNVYLAKKFNQRDSYLNYVNGHIFK